MLTGLAAAHAQMRRLTVDQAVAEIRQVLDGGTRDARDRQRALDEAASVYVLPSEAWPWSPAALAVLLDAGADRERAEQLRASPPLATLSGLGDQAGGLAGRSFGTPRRNR